MLYREMEQQQEASKISEKQVTSMEVDIQGLASPPHALSPNSAFLDGGG